ncbi:MAG TPA: sulfite exporter TauE/SafE family protein [Gammaproteobacteria bacterium]|nr:sulfite exporter TauE/SafE family protein [Gammaproteobacteria bacterium]
MSIEQVRLFIISLVGNIFSSFSGGGAGLIQLPALIFLGLPVAIALATHRAWSVAPGIGATIRHLREEPLERRPALPILLFGLPGVVWVPAASCRCLGVGRVMRLCR